DFLCCHRHDRTPFTWRLVCSGQERSKLMPRSSHFWMTLGLRRVGFVLVVAARRTGTSRLVSPRHGIHVRSTRLTAVRSAQSGFPPRFGLTIFDTPSQTIDT